MADYILNNQSKYIGCVIIIMSGSVYDIEHLTEIDFLKFKNLIYKNTGIFLRDTKVEMVNSRLLNRLRTLKISTFTDYYNYLIRVDDGTELLEMINCITTNKTDFFRENHHFEFMYKYILPKIKQNAYNTGNLEFKAWSAACSTGEEPYTIAIVLKDFFKDNTGWNLKVLASDLDTNVLKKAYEGVYTQEVVTPIPPHLLREYFYKGEEENKGFFKVKEKLQYIITFKKINLIDDVYPISSPLDVIFCRNVFIYFDNQTVEMIVNKFSRYLKPGGFLFLGHSESIDLEGTFKGRFKLVAHTVYMKI